MEYGIVTISDKYHCGLSQFMSAHPHSYPIRPQQEEKMLISVTPSDKYETSAMAKYLSITKQLENQLNLKWK